MPRRRRTSERPTGLELGRCARPIRAPALDDDGRRNASPPAAGCRGSRSERAREGDLDPLARPRARRRLHVDARTSAESSEDVGLPARRPRRQNEERADGRRRGRGRARKSTTGASRCASSSTSKNSRTEAERPGEHEARERLDRVVVRQHGVVVDLARDGDAVLRLGELGLELPEVLVRLELRVRLGDGEEAAERGSEDSLGLRRLGRRLRLLRAGARLR